MVAPTLRRSCAVRRSSPRLRRPPEGVPRARFPDGRSIFVPAHSPCSSPASCAVGATHTPARADALLPDRGVTAGGGRSLGGSNALTSAAGQAGAGRATGGSFVEVAGWLCRPGSSERGRARIAGGRRTGRVLGAPESVHGGMQFAIRLPASSAGAERPLEVRLHDVTGRLVRVLRADATAGEHQLKWDGRDSAARPCGPVSISHACGAAASC